MIVPDRPTELIIVVDMNQSRFPWDDILESISGLYAFGFREGAVNECGHSLVMRYSSTRLEVYGEP